jgi:hypothetical protein
MKTILGLLMAGALILPVQAAHAPAVETTVGAPIILVEGGCGRDYHRNDRGYCVPNWREWDPSWRACPPGWHLGSEGRRCWPN